MNTYLLLYLVAFIMVVQCIHTLVFCSSHHFVHDLVFCSLYVILARVQSWTVSVALFILLLQGALLQVLCQVQLPSHLARDMSNERYFGLLYL